MIISIRDSITSTRFRRITHVNVELRGDPVKNMNQIEPSARRLFDHSLIVTRENFAYKFGLRVFLKHFDSVLLTPSSP